jgi:hypothetical protein
MPNGSSILEQFGAYRHYWERSRLCERILTHNITVDFLQ